MIIQEICVGDAGGHLSFLPWHFALEWKMDKEQYRDENESIMVATKVCSCVVWKSQLWLMGFGVTYQYRDEFIIIAIEYFCSRVALQ